MQQTSHRPSRRQRGVSLIEAVVALAVMAFGMLGVVGLQATLRGSADLARQRSEALRIAQESVENWRTFMSVDADAANFDYTDIVAVGRSAVDLAGTSLVDRVNTTFYRTIDMPAPPASPRMKSFQVTIDWTDRAGQTQTVQLATTVAGISPALAGTLALPPNKEPFASPLGRNRNIPPGAKNLTGTNTSVFKPPQGSSGTVAWVFDNTSGKVTGVCTVSPTSTTSSLNPEDLTVCDTVIGQLLSGYVFFAGGEPTATEAEFPSGPSLNFDMVLTVNDVTGHAYPAAPVCFDSSVDNQAQAATRPVVVYYCLIFSNDLGTWGGRSRIAPRAFVTPATTPWVIGLETGQYKVCRYTPLYADAGTRNADHPLNYTTAGSEPYALIRNQNFLVIQSQYSCPTETPLPGDAFNSNTRLHQDGTTTYDNPP